MSWVCAAMAGAAGVYQLVAALASIAFVRLRKPTGSFTPPVSILKPLRQGHSMPEDALQTNRLQD
ncbi:MAG: ceramide glucosyltransferase, partial [Bryobacteraceae bacterium]